MPTEAAPELVAERERWATTTLLRYFSPRTGRWSTPTGEAWQPALLVEATVTSYELTRAVALLNVIEKSFARYRGRRSHFFDDDGWYLNAWLRAYDVTGDPKYLDESRAVFTAMTDGWDDTCRGGLWWNADRTYKNAITNELFLLGSARLYRRTGEPGYRDWAERAWSWFDASGLINDSGLVNDGLDGSCANNGDVTWTYNQGVILSALVELWRGTGDATLLPRAHRIADAAIASLTHPSGILREPSEPFTSNKDAHLFKGVFVQGLARLYGAQPAIRPRYRAFLAANADALWQAGRHPRKGVGLNWQGPVGWVTGATHGSAALLLSQLALLRVGGETTAVPRRDGHRYQAAGHELSVRRQRVTFDVEVVAGTHTLTFGYAAGAGDAYRSVLVDGTLLAERLLFAATKASPSTVSIDAVLPPGPHTITIPPTRTPLHLPTLTLTLKSRAIMS